VHRNNIEIPGVSVNRILKEFFEVRKCGAIRTEKGQIRAVGRIKLRKNDLWVNSERQETLSIGYN
jgi:hypothetical protein